MPAWTCRGDGVLPNGIAVFGGAGYWPTQGFPLDADVKARFGMDASRRLVDVNLLFDPMFDFTYYRERLNALIDFTSNGGIRR